jgi:hypothetical protein
VTYQRLPIPKITDDIGYGDYQDDPGVRTYLDGLFREHHPEVADEDVIKAVIDMQVKQYPVTLKLGAARRENAALWAALLHAEATIQSGGSASAKEAKALTNKLGKTEVRLAKTKEELDASERKVRELNNAMDDGSH